MQYWLRYNNAPAGPYSLAHLRRLVTQLSITSRDLVWTQGMASWSPLAQVLPALADLGSIRGAYPAYRPGQKVVVK